VSADSSFIFRYETYGPEGAYIAHLQVIPGPCYHGGRARVRAGDLISPGHRTNSWGDERGRADWVYFATEPATAAAYAQATGGHLYQVAPSGEVHSDGSGGDGSYRSQFPLLVIRRVPPDEWDSLPVGGAS